jgi:hypothetical protein
MIAVFNMNWNSHVPIPPKQIVSNDTVIEGIKKAIFLASGKEFFIYDVKNRKRTIIILRFAFFKLARKYSSYTYDEIGELFCNKFDHSTIIHGCKAIDDIEYIGFNDERYKTWNDINETFKTLIKFK